MKLAASNIGWLDIEDDNMYEYMSSNGFAGLEIAPTRIFSQQPYEHLEEAAAWAGKLKRKYGLTVVSLQSIWYGRQENIFGSDAEWQALLAYSKKAIDFARSVGAGNLVFGCPRNRKIPEDIKDLSSAYDIATKFFKELGDYGAAREIIVALEANPPIYNTNFINTTQEAIQLIQDVDSKGFKLNLDLGTMVENQEEISLLVGNVNLISHVHISEPMLVPIRPRENHRRLARLLADEGYDRYISLEMGNRAGLQPVKDSMEYIRGVFAV